MSQAISKIVSEMLDVPESEVKQAIVQMGLQDLVDIVTAIKKNDREAIFKIYSGYAV